MAGDLLYPYRFGRELLTLQITRLAIDGDTLEGARHIDSVHRALTLASIAEEWVELILSFKIDAPEDNFSDLLAPGTSPDAVDIWVVCRNRYTRMRRAAKLTREGHSFTGLLRLDRDEVTRATDLDCFAVLNADIETTLGYAWKAHQRLADSPGWKVYTDSIPPMPGGALNSRWLVFEESKRTELASRGDCVWYLDLSDAEAPELLLNEGVPKLRQTLEVEGKTGKAARVRDALIHSILQSVISDMTAFVLSRNAGASLDEIPEWQKKLLLTLARREPRASEDAVAESWLENWADTSQLNEVLAETGSAIQRHLNLSHSSQYLAESVESEVQNA